MKYTLLNVFKTINGKVDGNFCQHHVGTLETAIERAKAIESINSNKIDIAVVEETFGGILDVHYYRNRLDERRNCIE